MAWTTPITTFAVHDVLTSTEMNAIGANLNFLRNGVAATSLVTASVGPTSGTTPLTVATVSVNLDGNTKVAVDFWFRNINMTVNSDIFHLQLLDNGTQIQDGIPNDNGGGTLLSGSMRTIRTPSSGAHTFTATMTRTAGTGTATLSAASNQPAVLSVVQAT